MRGGGEHRDGGDNCRRGADAISLSLPEFVASLAALRIYAYDLAVSKPFGSNVANMTVLVLFDAAYTPGPLLAAVDPAQTVAALS